MTKIDEKGELLITVPKVLCQYNHTEIKNRILNDKILLDKFKE